MDEITVNSDTLKFIKERIVSVTELTRSNKLTEILDSFSDQSSDEVFLVQNVRNRSAQAVLVNFDYFQELLGLKETYEQLMDQVMLEIVEERGEEDEGIPLDKVLKDSNLDMANIYEIAERFQLE